MFARVTAEEIHEDFKPRWRGLLHFVFVFVSLVATVALWLVAQTPTARWVGVVYGLSLLTMYSISAAYHRGSWSTAARTRMRQLDHAGIFILIAGTYTPVSALGIPGWEGTLLLWAAWIGATLGVLHSLFFANWFRSLNIVLYVAFGCMAVPLLPAVISGLGLFRAALLMGGGVVYIAGAVIYGRKWPNPAPKVFGYHEVFHALVALASALHFAAVYSLLAR
jgi:hemolysin III